MSISEVEAMPGDEIEEWKAYFRTRVFTNELLDIHLAHVELFIARTMGGNKTLKLRKLLLLPYKNKRSVEQMAAEFMAATS